MLAEADAAHDECVARSKEYAPPFVTSWSVLAEAAWLLRRVPESLPQLMNLISSGLVVCPEMDADAAPMIADLARTYADLRPELADLTLLYLADRDSIENIFTLDRRDFYVYRTRRGKPLRLVPTTV
jgi:predicted nucleic acid-binding protein